MIKYLIIVLMLVSFNAFAEDDEVEQERPHRLETLLEKALWFGQQRAEPSDGTCPLLGSWSVLIFSSTKEVPICRAFRDIELMEKAGIDEDARLTRVCQINTIAEVTPACNGRVIQR